MASIISSGIGSGLNIQSLVAQLVQAERAPTENRLSSREALAQARISGFGGLKSALETFQTSLAKLQEASLYAAPEVEETSGFVATSENADVFTATAGATAVAGTYSVEVTQLLSANRIASSDVSDFVSGNKNGELTVTIGNGTGVAVAIPKGSSLEEIRGLIDAQTGISASLVTDDLGEHLVVLSDEAGADYNIKIENTGAGGANLDAFDTTVGGNYTTLSVGQDSIVKVDGFTYTRASTTFDDFDSDLLPGVTIDILKADAGTIYELTVAAEEEAAEDTSTETAVSKAVEDFVAAYNTLRTTLNDLTAYDQEANTQGLLNGDPTVRAIAASLRNVISDSVSGISGGIDTLAEIGVTTNVNDGTLEIDSEQLSAALEGNVDGFETLFSGPDGFATRLDSFINPYVQSAGLIDNRTDGLKSQIDRIESQREALNRRIIGIEERYLRQFTALDTLLGELQNSSNFLTSQLANLPGAVPINKR